MTIIRCLLGLIAASAIFATASQGWAQPLPSDHPRQIVEKVSAALTDKYPFPDIAHRYAQALTTSLEGGRYDGLDGQALGRAITADLRAIHSDRHLVVFASADYFRQATEENTDTATPAEREAERQALRDRNFGLRSVELDEATSTAYVAWPGSWTPDQETFDFAAHAMNLAAYSRNIIIDLRGNPGGAGEVGRFLASYFFAPGEEKYYLYGFEKDRSQDQQEWTYAYVPGRRAVDSRLWILVDSKTGSATEGFAFAMQKLGRATIVGETTAGAGIAGSLVPLLDNMVMFLPTKMIVAPKTDTGWEGTGVVPDISAGGVDARSLVMDRIREAAASEPRVAPISR